LILTTFEDDELLFEGLSAGARGYLLKDISLEELLVAIREVAEGGSYVKPAVTERLLRAVRKGQDVPDSPQPLMPLMERETHVLRLLASGYSNREIARALIVSVGTVKSHVSSILGKLGVRDRARAVLKGLQDGLL
jgi:DNA-binding NarL/FixJ family response regulator